MMCLWRQFRKSKEQLHVSEFCKVTGNKKHDPELRSSGDIMVVLQRVADNTINYHCSQCDLLVKTSLVLYTPLNSCGTEYYI